MLRACLLSACCWLVPLASAAEVPSCSQARVSQASARVRTQLATNNMRGADLPSHAASIEGETAPQPAMTEALAGYMRAVASCLPADADAHSIASELTGHLAAAADFSPGAPLLPPLPRPKTSAEFENDPFAVHFLVADTRRAADASRHTAILASYGPACGREGEMAVFSRNGSDSSNSSNGSNGSNGWQQDFAWTVPPFSLVASQAASAQLAMGQAVVGQDEPAPAKDGQNRSALRWYVAFAAREPACKQATNWVRLTVLITPRPGSTGPHAVPETALRDEFLADASNANPADWMRMSAQTGLLDVEFNGIHDASKEEIFAGRRAYRIAGQRAHRIEPVAFTPVEFVEIWLAAPWQDAVSWTDRMEAGLLKLAHQELANSRNGSGDESTAAAEKRRCCALFEAVYRCARKGTDSAERVEVVAQYPDYERLAGGGQRDFVLRAAGSGFVMERVGSQPDGTCGGENLLRQNDAAQ